MDKINVQAQPNDNGARVTGTGQYPLAVGDNTITVMVTAADGTTLTYTIVVTRADVAAPVLKAVVLTASMPVGAKAGAYATGFSPGEQVAVTMYSSAYQLGVFAADSQGRVDVTWTVPLDATVGEHLLAFDGASSGSVAAQFEVVDVVSSTGGHVASQGGVVGAVVPLAVGLVLLAVRRRNSNVMVRAV